MLRARKPTPRGTPARCGKVLRRVVMQLVKHLPAQLAVADQVGGAQGAELVGNGGYGHVELGGVIADATFLGGEQGNEPQPGGVGEGGEELRHFLRLPRLQMRSPRRPPRREKRQGLLQRSLRQRPQIRRRLLREQLPLPRLKAAPHQKTAHGIPGAVFSFGRLAAAGCDFSPQSRRSSSAEATADRGREGRGVEVGKNRIYSIIA